MSIAPVGGGNSPPIQWSPTMGSRTTSFVTKKSAEPRGPGKPGMDVVLGEATQILSYCADPNGADDTSAVLAVGYVQSGKTLSFTTLISLARDNGFGIVILLAGTTNQLKGQSERRLARDLSLEYLQRDWRRFPNPEIKRGSVSDIQKTLDGWNRFRAGKSVDDKPAVLITVLKSPKRIQSAADVLAKLDLRGVPTLIIDDESDQAGLNLKAHSNLLNGEDELSSTYEAILNLRAALPHNSVVQYTATPQANLLIAASDLLDPKFAKVISPGADYTGGGTFFDARTDLVVRVPDTEIFDPASPFPEPPENLQLALRVFLLGIAAEDQGDDFENRSMMVQAHQNTKPHDTYFRWVSNLLQGWGTALDGDDADAIAEVRMEFESAHAELRKTVKTLPDLDRLLPVVASRITDVHVVKVNSTAEAEKEIDWNLWDYWILVGGLKLDRGFTVEGLTVTYMPRRVSENADVLQQRARFFGYKADYLDYCRVFLIADAIEAFKGYVEDEEFLREALRTHEGKPLNSWRRQVSLHRQISRPTRSSVVGRRVKRIPLSEGWGWPKSLHLDAESITRNQELFENLRAELGPALVDSVDVVDGLVDLRRGDRNLIAPDFGLENLRELIDRIRRTAPGDSLWFGAVDIALARSSVAGAQCDVVFMNDLQPGLGRSLKVLRDNIHVGQNPPAGSGRSLVYSGDRKVATRGSITVQLRMVKLTSPTPARGADFERVPWVAIRLPKDIQNDAILQDD